jgi:hypothetical protein
MNARVREDESGKRVIPAFARMTRGKAPVIPVFFPSFLYFYRHSCAGRNPSPHLFSVIIFLKVQAWQI